MLSILSIRLWIGELFFGTLGSAQYPRGVRVSKSRLIKGPCDEAEVEALRYVAAHTNIPVPTVFRTHLYRGQLYIEMEYVHGQDLSDVWQSGTLSLEQKRQIMRELGGYIAELRSLEPPKPGLVASADSKELFDRRIGSNTVGPFQNHEEFNSMLRGGVPLEKCADVFGQLVKTHHERTYRSCFTHGDIQLRNVIVRGGHLAAIIDWESAGWYPEYWEWTKAHYNLYNIPDWAELLESELPRYDEELAAERALWKIYDCPEDATQTR